MSLSPILLSQKFTIVAIMLALGGCAQEQLSKKMPDPLAPPPPRVNETRFDESLACMDKLFISNGVRDVVVLSEDLSDNTGKVKVGTRDMLFTAISDMTRRSGAIRAIGYGKDASNIQAWLEKYGAKNNVYNFQPAYSIRGGLTQMDEGLVSMKTGANVQFGPIGGGRQGSSSIALLGTDFNIMSTKTFEILPGVNSRNSVNLERSGEGSSFVLSFGGQQNQQNSHPQQGPQGQPPQPQGQGGGGLQGSVANGTFGVSFYVGVEQQQGIGGGVRSLVELATIEMFGKLLRVPYWQCLGISSSHPKVQREIADWYFTLTNEGKLVSYMQNQLRIMGKYNGPVNGTQNREFYEALKEVAMANKLPAPQTVDERLFSVVLNLPNKNILIPKEPLAFAKMEDIVKHRQPVPGLGKPKGGFDRLRLSFVQSASRKPTPDGAPLDISLRLDGVEEFAKNGTVVVNKRPESGIQAFLYCYAVSDGGATTTRFFPNDSVPVPVLKMGQEIRLTGDQGLPIKVAPGMESIFCHVSDTDPAMNPGKTVVGRDFEERQNPIKVIQTAVGATVIGFYGDANMAIRRK